MDLSLPVRPIARTALTRLIDYAGLFPPAERAMPAAVAEYAGVQAGPHAWMVGRFVAPASRLRELRRAAGAKRAPSLSVVVDVTRDPYQWFDQTREALLVLANLRAHRDPIVRVDAVEIPLPALVSQRETYDAVVSQLSAMLTHAKLRDVPVYAEIPRTPRWAELLPGACLAAIRARVSLKVRCGGATADAFPSVTELAAFLVAAAREGVPFKATAGLHHAVRRTDATSGVAMHGFVNVLLASLVAADGGSAGDVEAALAEEDAAAFVFADDELQWRGRRFDAQTVAAVREHGFVGYGSCSISEPVDDLVALGVLPHIP